MTDKVKKTKASNTRRTEADLRARDKADAASLIAVYGADGKGKKPAPRKK